MIKTIIFLFLSSVMSFNLWAEALSADALYGKIRERFPELQLPETTPTIVHVGSEAVLKSAIENVSGHKVICVSGTIKLEEYLSRDSIAPGSRVTIVGVTKAGDFKYATITGKGITSTFAEQVDIANLYFTNIVRENTDDGMGNAISLGKITGEHRITSVTIDNCSSTVGSDKGGAISAPYLDGKTPLLIYNTTIGENCVAKYNNAAPLYVSDARTLSLINCTIIASDGKDKFGNDVKKNVYWLNTKQPNTIENIILDQAPTSTMNKQSYKVENNLVWVEDEVTLPHYEIRAEVALPDEVVILPSGQRQVYFGWTTTSASQVKAQKSTDDGATWADIAESEVDRRSPTSPEMTVDGWSSIRYLCATPGSTAKYRLAFSSDGANWGYSEAKEITNPTPVVSLHSRPGAKKTIYLDFSGYIDDYKANVASMRYNITAKSSLPYLETPAFVFAGRFANKQINEIKTAETDLSETYPLAYAVYDIWRMVAEDFMMFDVDVTTEEPDYDGLVKSSADDDTYGKRVIFDYAPNGRWYAGSGGISGLGAFGFRVDRPAYIFGANSRRNLACQATHETSHTLGLAHDGGYIYLPNVYAEDGTLVAMFVKDDYYTGQDVQADYKFTTWYPVMGGVPLPSSNNGKWVDLDYYDFINQFSNGNYDGATNKGDDDFAVMLGLVAGSREQAELDSVIVFPGKLYPDGRDSCEVRNLTLAKDDAGDTIAEAKRLVANGETSLSTTGVIGKHIEGTEVVDDVDVFAVAVTGAGTITAKVVPGYLDEIEGASLDAKVELLSASGDVLVMSEGVKDGSADFREAGVSFECEAKGKYFIRVSGTNHQIPLKVAPEGYEVPTDGWNANAKDNYGSVGPYKLTLDLDGAEFTTPSDGRSKALRIIVR